MAKGYVPETLKGAGLLYSTSTTEDRIGLLEDQIRTLEATVKQRYEDLAGLHDRIVTLEARGIELAGIVTQLRKEVGEHGSH